MGFQPIIAPDCYDQYRLMTGSCASVSYKPGTNIPNGRYLCQATPCCSTKVTVCRYEDGSMGFDVEPPYSPNINCNTLFPIDANQSSCFPSCDWLLNLRVIESYGLIKKDDTDDQNKKNNVTSSDNNTTVNVFNVSGTFHKIFILDDKFKSPLEDESITSSLPAGSFIYTYYKDGILHKGMIYSKKK